MPSPDAIERLVDHVCATTLDDISDPAMAAAKTFILDTFGVAIAGSKGPYVGELMDSARGWGSDKTALVWGSTTRLSAPSAALINGYQAHNSEYDAIHEGAVIHPLASILGSVLAVAERDGRLSGRDLLTAAVLGVDVSCSIGMGATETLKFFRPATGGSFGAVAALCKARGFDREKMIAAFGILLGQIGGTMQAHEEGSPLLGMQLGFCTRAAVTACDMAAMGMTGPRRVLEGDFGFYALFEGGSDIAAGFAGLGEDWRITDVSHKPFPSGRATHGVIDGVLLLRERHGIAASDVAAVRAEVPPLVHQLTGRPIIENPNVNYARLCIPYVGAVALSRGSVGIEDFQPECLSDPELFALARRFEVSIRDVGDPNALIPQRVSIELKDGRVHSIELETVLGSPAKPLSEDQHLAKFRRNWINGAGTLAPEDGEVLIGLVAGLEDVDDCRDIIGLMTAR